MKHRTTDRTDKGQVPDTKLEKRLVLKLDLILLPVLWWMYILAYIDRGNVVSLTPLHIVVTLNSS